MTDKGWGCLFSVGIFSAVSVVFYWIAYFVLGLVDMSDGHRVAMSVLVGISATLGVGKILD